MSLDHIVGQVKKVTPAGKSTAVSLYLGNLKLNQTDQDNHVYMTAFVNPNNKVLQNINANDVISAKGKLDNRKSKAGFMELVMNANTIQACSSGLSQQWGLYPNKSASIFISGVFTNNAGGYEVSARYDESTPIVNNGSIEYVKDTRNLKFKISKSNYTFKCINRAIKELTGTDLQNAQATSEQLKVLSKCTALVNFGLVTANTNKKELNGINGTNTYLNMYAENIMFFNKIGTTQQASAPQQQAPQQQAPKQAPASQQQAKTPKPAAEPQQQANVNNQNQQEPFKQDGNFDNNGFSNQTDSSGRIPEDEKLVF